MPSEPTANRSCSTGPSAIPAKAHCLNLENSALTYRPERLSPTADAGLTLPRTTFNAIMTAENPPDVTLEQAVRDAVEGGAIQVSGDPDKIYELFALFDTLGSNWNLIEP